MMNVTSELLPANGLDSIETGDAEGTPVTEEALADIVSGNEEEAAADSAQSDAGPAELATDGGEPDQELLADMASGDEAAVAADSTQNGAVPAELAIDAEEPGQELLADMASGDEAAVAVDSAQNGAVPAELAIDAEKPDQEEHSEEPPEEAQEPAERIDDGRAWFVVHSYSGYENKVKNNLRHRIESMNMQDKIFQVVVPTEEEIEIKEGHRRKTKRRVFPGYILVQMLMDEESWYVVRNTPGVTGFVGSGSKPTPLRPEEASKIFDRMEADAPKIKVGFREGETVRIVDGPFVDFVGVVEDLNLDKGKVTVMVAFFGRETPVELDFLQVQKQ